MRAVVKGAGLALVLVLSGCELLQPFEAHEPAPSVQVEIAQPVANVESLLLYFQHIRRMPAASFEREHEAVQRAFTEEPSELNRLRLAMVLALPNTPVSDSARALELLGPLIKDDRARLHRISVLIGTLLEEQRRLATTMNVTQQRLDEVMNTYQQDRRRHESSVQDLQRKHETNIQELQRKYETSLQEVQKKLEQLKSLERSLIQREREGPVRR